MLTQNTRNTSSMTEHKTFKVVHYIPNNAVALTLKNGCRTVCSALLWLLISYYGDLSYTRYVACWMVCQLKDHLRSRQYESICDMFTTSIVHEFTNHMLSLLYLVKCFTIIMMAITQFFIWMLNFHLVFSMYFLTIIHKLSTSIYVLT